MKNPFRKIDPEMAIVNRSLKKLNKKAVNSDKATCGMILGGMAMVTIPYLFAKMVEVADAED